MSEVFADTVTVAVASNFAPAARDLAEKFEEIRDHEVRISPGSTGRLYAQIVNGAPYDLFLAADTVRTANLDRDEMIVPGSRFVYATGRLVFWSAVQDVEQLGCDAVLKDPGNARVAIANPRLAPYGAAALAYMKSQPWYDGVSNRLVFGENIAQTFQFVATGNASFGFIALSQLPAPDRERYRCVLDRHPDVTLDQEAVVLDRAATSEGAIAFAEFLRSPEGLEIIAEHGYGARLK